MSTTPKSRTILLVLVALLAALLPATTASAHPSKSRLDLDAATIPYLQQQMARGRLSATELTLLYLQRIRTVDPKVNAVLKVNPAALLQAAQSDVRRYRHQLRGPLDGIPVLLKDNIDTANLQTTAGSRALLRPAPDKDAVLVQKLRAAGAVILGKANLSEWANFRSTSATSGWSGVGGQTNNPYVLDRNPCGSSSGSAAGVAASLAQVAIGTETDGSIVCPAGQNGVVGIKPTLGLVSRTGVVPISAQQDTAGPIGRHVIDVAITLSALQGKDLADPATLAIPSSVPTDYAKALRNASLKGKRIGVWSFAGADAGVDKVVATAVANLKKVGAVPVTVELPYQDEIGANESPALVVEFKSDLQKYLAARPGSVNTLAQLIAFNKKDSIELSKFGQELFVEAAAAPPITDPTYKKQRATATRLAKASIDQTLKKYKLDAIMAPTNSPAWVTTYGEGDAFVFGSSGPAAVSGYPNVTVPAGYVGELPVGVSFFAGRWSDASVLALAAAYEQATKARHAPKYLPTID